VKERYVPIRPGILEHLLRGDISAFEFGVYVIVHLQADYGTGIWRGSAPRILNSAPRGAKLREVQRALERLTELGLLKHFHQHGQRGNFAFLINKFTVRSGALTGMRLNAAKSESWQSPVYESCADVDADDSADDDAQDAPIQEGRRKREEGRKKKEAPAPPSPSVFTGQHFSVSQRQDALLGEAFPWVDRPAQYRKADSWMEDNPERRPKKSSRFLHNWFQRVSPPKGKTDAKLSATDLAIRNAKDLGLAN
jgi:hypothetical protein